MCSPELHPQKKLTKNKIFWRSGLPPKEKKRKEMERLNVVVTWSSKESGDVPL
jgi:hypothetical protein